MHYNHPVLMEMNNNDYTTSSLSHIEDSVVLGSRPTNHNTTANNPFDHIAAPGQEEVLITLEYNMPNLFWMLIAGFVGLVAGALLNSANIDPTVQRWIGEIGVLYVNIMECLSLPLIFTTVTICIAHLVIATKTVSVMSRMLFMFFIAALLSACLAMLVSYAMAFTFRRQLAPHLSPSSTYIALQCPNNKYLASNGSMCTGKRLKDALQLYATNITGLTLQNMDDERPNMKTTYAQQISNFFSIVFQQNITDAFANGSFLGVIIFAMFVGKGLVVSQEYIGIGGPGDVGAGSGKVNYVFVILTQFEVVLELILNWFIQWIPLGTVSSMTFSIMTGTLSESPFQQSMYLPITLFITIMLYFILVVCVAYYILLRKNPLHFLWYLMPAIVFMFASGSYMATVPVMMRSIESSKQISKTLSQYAVSLGTGLSLCGNAAYFVISCVFMAYTSGLQSQLTAGRIVLLILISTLSSFGAPQTHGVPTTYVATIWLTVFTTTIPDSFPFVVMVEWLMARMRRVQNITVVAFIARVIADQVDETAEDEADRGYGSLWNHEPVQTCNDH